MLGLMTLQYLSMNGVLTAETKYEANQKTNSKKGEYMRKLNVSQAEKQCGWGSRICGAVVLTFIIAVVQSAFGGSEVLNVPDHQRFTADRAQQMILASQELLKPVYKPLAEQIVADYDLADKTSGIGIDLGSGPGNLIFELCQLTDLHWVNADINPHFFAHFYAQAEKNNLTHRVSAVFADAQAMPFRDNYADIIVSRGSYHFWDDKELGFSEVMRVLKPGAVAFIGRGFARDMPVEAARSIRQQQGRRMSYDAEAEVERLKRLFEQMKIESYRIEIPEPSGAEDLNYGIWIELQKPKNDDQCGQ